MKILQTSIQTRSQEESGNKKEDEKSNATSSSSSVDTALAPHLTPILDPMPPPPFRCRPGELEERYRNLQAKDASAPLFLTPPILEAIQRYGYCIIDGFTERRHGVSGIEMIQSALVEAKELYASQQLTPAGMKADSSSSASASATSSNWKSTALRGDAHKWLHPNDATEAEKLPYLHRLMNEMDGIRKELNTILSTSTVTPPSTSPAASASPPSASSSSHWSPSLGCEFQLASYHHDGSRYVAHRDAISGQLPQRRLTAIIYLSKWIEKEQGGWLRLHTIPALDLETNLNSNSNPSPLQVNGNHYDVPYFNRQALEFAPLPQDGTVLIAQEDAITSSSAASSSSSSFSSSSSSLSRPSYLDVAPLRDRVVLFASTAILHEVRPSYNLERFALTMWIK